MSKFSKYLIGGVCAFAAWSFVAPVPLMQIATLSFSEMLFPLAAAGMSFFFGSSVVSNLLGNVLNKSGGAPAPESGNDDAQRAAATRLAKAAVTKNAQLRKAAAAQPAVASEADAEAAKERKPAPVVAKAVASDEVDLAAAAAAAAVEAGNDAGPAAEEDAPAAAAVAKNDDAAADETAPRMRRRRSSKSAGAGEAAPRRRHSKRLAKR